jgi:hypothetical protein
MVDKKLELKQHTECGTSNCCGKCDAALNKTDDTELLFNINNNNNNKNKDK